MGYWFFSVTCADAFGEVVLIELFHELHRRVFCTFLASGFLNSNFCLVQYQRLLRAKPKDKQMTDYFWWFPVFPITSGNFFQLGFWQLTDSRLALNCNRNRHHLFFLPTICSSGRMRNLSHATPCGPWCDHLYLYWKWHQLHVGISILPVGRNYVQMTLWQISSDDNKWTIKHYTGDACHTSHARVLWPNCTLQYIYFKYYGNVMPQLYDDVYRKPTSVAMSSDVEEASRSLSRTRMPRQCRWLSQINVASRLRPAEHTASSK